MIWTLACLHFYIVKAFQNFRAIMELGFKSVSWNSCLPSNNYCFPIHLHFVYISQLTFPGKYWKDDICFISLNTNCVRIRWIHWASPKYNQFSSSPNMRPLLPGISKIILIYIKSRESARGNKKLNHSEKRSGCIIIQKLKPYLPSGLKKTVATPNLSCFRK